MCAEYMFGESEPDISRRTLFQGNEKGERSNFTSDFIMYFKEGNNVDSYDDFSFAVEVRLAQGETRFCT